MPHRTVFTPENLADLQRICDEVEARLTAAGYQVAMADVAQAIMAGAALCDDNDLIAAKAFRKLSEDPDDAAI